MNRMQGLLTLLATAWIGFGFGRGNPEADPRVAGAAVLPIPGAHLPPAASFHEV